MSAPRPLRIMSGGQTGVDRAALDAAAACGRESGGWCPAGRGAEDGAIPARYPLRETPSSDPAQRTQWNVRDSDATLVLSREAPRGGTALTIAEARRQGRPLLALRLEPGASRESLARAWAWLETARVHALNVAGPRESEEPGVGDDALGFLRALLGA
jgi:hypothetical protein